MEILRNSHTKTVHKPAEDASHRQTQCGALTRVPDSRIERLEAEVRTTHRSQQCGRCFPGNGGY
jgi:hypothetical protein